VHQPVLADDSPLPLNKRHQYIKGAPAEVDRPTVGEELAAIRHDPETAELDDRRRFGWGRLRQVCDPTSVRIQNSHGNLSDLSPGVAYMSEEALSHQFSSEKWLPLK
jgi:hypothetical protein